MSRRSFVIQVPLSGGKPDIKIAAPIVEEGGGIFHAMWDGEQLAMMQIGTSGPDNVYACVATAGAYTALAHLGSKVELLNDAWQNGAKKTELAAFGVKEDGGTGKPIAPITFAGDDPIALGADEV